MNCNRPGGASADWHCNALSADQFSIVLKWIVTPLGPMRLRDRTEPAADVAFLLLLRSRAMLSRPVPFSCGRPNVAARRRTETWNPPGELPHPEHGRRENGLREPRIRPDRAIRRACCEAKNEPRNARFRREVTGFKEWTGAGSNRRHTDFQSGSGSMLCDDRPCFPEENDSER